ncbi:MAG: 4'-phosphopantetheinyl transferase superfamily protein [Oscillospiraceae bacterium]|nr:4'-phosphopantetheinyl transferase superfamily protein [Oscillospiraceae bacterium]
MRTRLYIASSDPLKDSARFDCLARTIPAARREKLASLKNGVARRLSLAASLLLARALQDEGLHADKIALSEYGKPWLPALPEFHFSLSHSGNMALCAVSSDPVGCDIELPRAFDPKLARRFFHPAECEWLFSQPEAEQYDAFFRIWTGKESFMKALGLGFALPMESFAVVPYLAQAVDRRPWQLRSVRDGEAYIALCGLTGVEDAPLVYVDFREA